MSLVGSGVGVGVGFVYINIDLQYSYTHLLAGRLSSEPFNSTAAVGRVSAGLKNIAF